jgi:chromosome segregation ATPase
MELLTPSGINRERKVADAEARERVYNLAQEETRLVSSVNVLCQKERDQAYRLSKATAETDAERERLRQTVSKEVEELEKRREKALEPIVALQLEVDTGLRKNVEEAKRLQAFERNLGEREVWMGSVIEKRDKALTKEESRVAAKDAELKERESVLSVSETNLLDAKAYFENERAEFNKEVLRWNDHYATESKRLEKLAKHLEDQRLVNEDVQRWNAEESARLKREDIAIRDKYATLEKTIVHLNHKNI